MRGRSLPDPGRTLPALRLRSGSGHATTRDRVLNARRASRPDHWSPSTSSGSGSCPSPLASVASRALLAQPAGHALQRMLCRDAACIELGHALNALGARDPQPFPLPWFTPHGREPVARSSPVSCSEPRPAWSSWEDCARQAILDDGRRRPRVRCGASGWCSERGRSARSSRVRRDAGAMVLGTLAMCNRLRGRVVPVPGTGSAALGPPGHRRGGAFSDVASTWRAARPRPRERFPWARSRSRTLRRERAGGDVRADRAALRRSLPIPRPRTLAVAGLLHASARDRVEKLRALPGVCYPARRGMTGKLRVRVE
jgi:hypothetical protein